MIVKTEANNLDDDVLMAKLATGDVAILGELYMRHSSMVQGAIRRFAPSIPHAQIQEMSQDIFMLLHTNASHYAPQGKFRAYLYGISVKKARTWERNHRLRCFLLQKTPAETFQTSAAPDNSPADQVTRREIVVQMLNRLPKRHRTVLILHSVEGFTSDEIADILHISARTVRTRLFRARKTLLENVNSDVWSHGLQRES